MKRALSLVLAAALVLGSVPAGFAATSTAGETLKGYGLVAGDTNGNLNEDKTITRGEMMVVLARLLGKFEEAKAYSIPSTSKDVAGHWAANYIAYAEKEGWTAGKGNGMFDPQGTVTLQEVSVFMLKALGYTADWNTAVKAATDLGLLKEVVATDAAAKVLRSDVFTSALNTINTPVKDSTVKLGEKLGVLKPVVVVEKVDVKSAVALNSKTVEVVLNTAIKTVDAKSFTVKDAAGAAVNVTAAALAAYDATGKTVLVSLEKDTTAGTLYTLTAEGKNVNFGGKAADTTKPAISSITSTDYNEVTVVFDEAIKLETAKITLAKKYGDKAALAITATKYKNATTLVLTTADQADATLYAAVVEGTTDFAGNVMTKDEAKTFVGTAKSTAAQTVAAAKALDYKTIYVEFGVNVDTTTVAAANFTLAEMYGTKAAVAIADAKMATTTQAGKYLGGTPTTAQKEAAAKKGVVLTLTGEVKDATLYKLTVTKVATLYGKALSTTETDTYKTFTGVSKPAADSVVYTAAATSNTTVDLTFANDVDPVSGAVAANYTIAKAYGDKAALAVTKAEVDANVVTLTVAPMAVDMYKVTAVNVKDVYGNSIKTTSDANIQGFAGKAVAAKITTVSAVDSAAPSVGTVRVTFNQNIGEGALDVSSYSIDNGIGYPTKVTKVDDTNVDLTIAKTVTGKLYTLTVKGVKNSDGVAMDAAGLTTTFVGNDATAAAPRLEAAVAVDNKTIKLYFDTKVTDISGAATATNYTITGANDTTPDFAVVDETNDKVLILMTATTAGFEHPTANTISIVAAGTGLDASYNTVTMAESTTAPTAIKVDGVVATSANTLTIYFNQPVRIFTGANVYVDNDASGTNNAGDFTVAAYRALNTEKTQWEVRLSGSFTTTGSVNLVIDETAGAAVISNGDATTRTAALYDATGTTTISLAKTTSLTAYIKDVYAVATNARTLVVYYPEAMNATEAATPGTYTITDPSGAAVLRAVYDAEKYTVTLTLDKDLTNNEPSLVIADDSIHNAIGNKLVAMAAGAAGGDVSIKFAKSSTVPAKVTVTKATNAAQVITLTFSEEFKTSADITAANVLDFVTVKINGTALTAAQLTGVVKNNAAGAAETDSSVATGNFIKSIVITVGAAPVLTANQTGSVEFKGTVTATGIKGQASDTSMAPFMFVVK